MGIVNGVSEYFLGTERHKLHKKERALYREMYTGKRYKIKRVSSFASEFFEIEIGKVLSDVLDAASLAYSAYTSDWDTGFIGTIGGESLRMLSFFLFSIYHRRVRGAMNQELKGDDWCYRNLEEIERREEEKRMDFGPLGNPDSWKDTE